MAAPTRTSRAGSVNATLTGFFNDQSEAGRWVGLKAAPFTIVDGLGGTYSRQDDTGWLNLKESPGMDDALSDNAPAKQIAMVDATEVVALERDAYTTVAPISRIKAAAALGQDYDIRAMRRVAGHIHNRHELQVMTILSDSANFGYDADPGNFTTASTSLILPVKALMDSVAGSIGYDPNVAVINPDVARYLENLDEVAGWNGQFFNNAATPAARGKLVAFFREMFDLELIVSKTKYTAADGTLAYMMGDHIAIYHSDNTGLPSFITTFGNYWLGDTSGPMSLAGIRDFPSYDPEGTVYAADALYKVQSDNANAGGILTDVLT